jgi:hypothetical protein
VLSESLFDDGEQPAGKPAPSMVGVYREQPTMICSWTASRSASESRAMSAPTASGRSSGRSAFSPAMNGQCGVSELLDRRGMVEVGEVTLSPELAQ